MRIDLVFPRFKRISGAERSILEFAAALATQGHRPRLVCHRFDPSCRPLVGDGVMVEESGARLDFFRNRYANAAFDYVRVLGLAGRLDPDADARVLCGPALLLAAYERVVRRSSKPLVYHCFEPPRALYQDRAAVLRRAGPARLPLALALSMYRWVDRYLVRFASSLTTVGPYSARSVQAVYGRVALPLTHGLDRPPLDAARQGAEQPRYDLITVNSLHPRKRVDLIIGAIAQLSREGVTASLDVVGDGPERVALEQLADRLGVRQRVNFSGFVPDRELPAHYCAARGYVHAAREESLGLSVIEAAYCGLPIIAVAEGGVVDNVVEGVTGYLVPSTSRGLAEGIARLLALEDRGANMGARGRELVADRYDWGRGAEELVGVIEAAL